MPKKKNQEQENKEETEEKEESEKESQEKKEVVKKVSEKEFEKAVIDLSKKGITSEKIGIELKKQGIHPKEYSKKISEILGKEFIDPELKNLEKKLKKIEEHCKKNTHDQKAIREKSRIFSQIRKRKEYLKILN